MRILLLSFLLISIISWAQSPCSSPKAHEFDFWIGSWTVYQNGTDKIVGYNNIVPVADGCGIQENWKSVDGSNVGTSLNKYTFRKGKWQQFWVDNSGLTLELEGNYADDKMIMTGSIPAFRNNPALSNKITWTKNADGSVRQFWEQSTDEGKTWTVAFDGLYKK